MDTIFQKYTSLQVNIFRLLCIKSGLKLSQREISKLLKVSPTAVGKSIYQLQKDSIIIVEQFKDLNLKLVSLNRNQNTLNLKRIENLRQIQSSNLIKYLENLFPGSTIILFGSYSNGGDTYTSDIDIAIINCKEKDFNCKSFEKILQRDININIYSSFRGIHKELLNNLCNGIVLSGFIEL